MAEPSAQQLLDWMSFHLIQMTLQRTDDEMWEVLDQVTDEVIARCWTAYGALAIAYIELNTKKTP